MNFWTPTWDNWGGGRDDSTMPWYAKYDYVEAYDWDEETDTFNLRFRDDFNFLDRSIWFVNSNGGFESNSCRFMDTHAYTSEGVLYLKMDKDLNPRQPNDVWEGDSSPDYEENPVEECPVYVTYDDLTLDGESTVFGNRCEARHNRSACEGLCSDDDCFQAWSSEDLNGWLSD